MSSSGLPSFTAAVRSVPIFTQYTFPCCHSLINCTVMHQLTEGRRFVVPAAQGEVSGLPTSPPLPSTTPPSLPPSPAPHQHSHRRQALPIDKRSPCPPSCSAPAATPPPRCPVALATTVTTPRAVGTAPNPGPGVNPGAAAASASLAGPQRPELGVRASDPRTDGPSLRRPLFDPRRNEPSGTGGLTAAALGARPKVVGMRPAAPR